MSPGRRNGSRNGSKLQCGQNKKRFHSAPPSPRIPSSTPQAMGQYFCDTILDYFDPDPAKRDAVIEELR